jgi:hypothetical protein
MLDGYKPAYPTGSLIRKGERAIALEIHSGGDIKVAWKNIMIKEMK